MIELSKPQTSNSGLTPIASGLVYGLGSTLALAVLLSLLLFLSGMKESSLNSWIYMIHMTSLLIGGYVTGRRKGQRGWYYGALLGIVYALIIGLIGYLGFDTALTWKSLITLLLCIFSASLGGIIGVNTAK